MAADISAFNGLTWATLGDTGGLLRLAPAWVPRSFLQPGKRLKLHPDDLIVLVEVEDECGGLPEGQSEELFHSFEERGADR